MEGLYDLKVEIADLADDDGSVAVEFKEGNRK
jgi:hypothetical protein